MAQSFEQLQQEIIDRAKAEIKQARHDYDQGMNDCKNGIYDKDDGRAYDLGWVFQNQTTQNETVKFVRG